MQHPLHTILGATGATGRAVIQELQRRKLSFNAVSQSNQLPGIPTIQANLLQEEEAVRAIQSSSIVYLCVGLPYKASLWAEAWPQLMRNVIHACQQSGARLVFFDNIYMYGPAPLALPFDEKHPQRPVTKKGQARKRTADLLVEAMAAGQVEALIGRSADFYGPFATNSMWYPSFLENMLKGKAPQILAPKDVPHTYAYSGDNGKALVALAMEDTAYGEVWHLPVGAPITLEEVVDMFNTALETSFKAQYMPGLTRRMLGLFVLPIKELEEMRYQFAEPYVMSYGKFSRLLPDFRVTSYPDGIKRMISSFQLKTSA